MNNEKFELEIYRALATPLMKKRVAMAMTLVANGLEIRRSINRYNDNNIRKLYRVKDRLLDCPNLMQLMEMTRLP